MENMRTVKVNDKNYPNWRLDISKAPDGGGDTVSWSGVECGPLTLHDETSKTLVLKEAGHSWYLNQYQGQQYEPAKFIVFSKEEDGSVTKLTEFYLKEEHNKKGA